MRAGPAVFLTTAVGFWLRARELGADSLWADEFHVAAAAGQGVVRAIQLAAADVHPPLFYVLAALINPSDAHALRWISVVCGTLTVALVGLCASRLAGAYAVLIGAGWLAVLPAHIHWSQEARPYAFLGLLLAGIGGNIALRGPVVLTALLSAAVAYSHGLAPIYLLGPLVASAAARAWPHLLATVAGGATIAPWLGVALLQTGRYRAFAAEEASVREFVSTSIAYLGSGHGVGAWTGVPVLLVLGLALRRPGPARGPMAGAGLAFLALAASGLPLGGLLAKHAVPLLGPLAIALGAYAGDGRRALLLAVVLLAPMFGLRAGAWREPVRFDVRAVVADVIANRGAPPLASNAGGLVRFYAGAPSIGVNFADEPSLGEVHDWQRRTFAGRTDSAWWIVEDPADGLLAKVRARYPVVWVSERRGALGVAVTLSPGEAALPTRRENVQLEHADGTLAFYQAGRAHFVSPASGGLALWSRGTTAGEPSAELSVTIGGTRSWTCPALPVLQRWIVGDAVAGDEIEIAFRDEKVAGDLNAWVYRVEVLSAAADGARCTQAARSHQ